VEYAQNGFGDGMTTVAGQQKPPSNASLYQESRLDNRP